VAYLVRDSPWIRPVVLKPNLSMLAYKPLRHCVMSRTAVGCVEETFFSGMRK
jgi:hypothetical protein